jgi:outer membrane protein TolC
MKQLKVAIRFAIKLKLLLLISTLAVVPSIFAAGSKAPEEAPGAAEKEFEGPFLLNPDTLRVRLLEDNFELLYGAARIRESRIQLDQARSAILPTLRLGVNFLTFGVFGLAFSGADFLLNFLIPTRWFQNFQQKALVKAEETAYLSLKLNQYNAALNLYFGVLSDIELRNFLAEQEEDAEELEFLAEQAYQNGYGSEIDVAQAAAQVRQTRFELAQVESLLKKQFGNIKKGLALPQSSELRIDMVRLPVSELEDLEFKKAFETVYEKAPEKQQLEYVAQAARMGRWSAIFAFIQSLTASAAVLTGPDGRPRGVDLSFDQLRVNGSFDIGAYHFPRIKLSSQKIEEVKLRQEELRFEIERLVFVALQQVALAREALQNARVSENRQAFVYEAQKRMYLEGRIGFSELVQTKARLQSATLNRVQAETSLQALRAGLHRMNLTDRYKGIESCHVSELKERDFGKLVKKKKSVSEICRESLELRDR